MTVYDYIGLTGVVLAVYSYARVQWQRDYAKHLSYSILNFFGSMFVIISLTKNWNLSSFTCNAIWGTISLYGIYRCLKYIWRAKRAVKAPPAP